MEFFWQTQPAGGYSYAARPLSSLPKPPSSEWETSSDLRSRPRKNLPDPEHGNQLPGQRRPGSEMGEMGKMAAAVGSVATLAAEPGEDAFRKLFRFYRQSRPGTVDLGGVIDFSVAHAARGTGPGAHKVRREERRAPPRRHASLLGEVSVFSYPLFASRLMVIERSPPSMGAQLNCPESITLWRWRALLTIFPRSYSWLRPRSKNAWELVFITYINCPFEFAPRFVWKPVNRVRRRYGSVLQLETSYPSLPRSRCP